MNAAAAKRMCLRTAVLGLLTLMAAAASPADHPAVARDMAGVWLPDSRNSGRLPQKWPLNAEAQRAVDKYQQQYGPIDPRIDDANTSCLPEAHPYSMRLIAQYPMELLFTPGRATFFFEVYGGIRRVFLDGQRRDDVLPSVMGYSVGRWEGDTLVIETTHIRKEGAGRFSGNPPVSAARRIVERISSICRASHSPVARSGYAGSRFPSKAVCDATGAMARCWVSPAGSGPRYPVGTGIPRPRYRVTTCRTSAVSPAR